MAVTIEALRRKSVGGSPRPSTGTTKQEARLNGIYSISSYVTKAKKQRGNNTRLLVFLAGRSLGNSKVADVISDWGMEGIGYNIRR
jgi:hypothetical protein